MEWKIFKNDNCPNCGDSLKVFSKIPETEDKKNSTCVFDGEKVLCMSECGFESIIYVTGEGEAFVPND